MFLSYAAQRYKKAHPKATQAEANEQGQKAFDDAVEDARGKYGASLEGMSAEEQEYFLKEEVAAQYFGTIAAARMDQLAENLNKTPGLLEKVTTVIRELLDKLKDAFNRLAGGDMVSSAALRSVEAQSEHLQNMLDTFTKYAEQTRADREARTEKTGEQIRRQAEQGVAESDAGPTKNSYKSVKGATDEGFIEDKYYQRQISHLDQIKEGSYITVGRFNEGSPLQKVGLPIGKVYFDVSKISKVVDKHDSQMSENTLNRLPELLKNPIVITEYMPGKNTNSISVFGNLLNNEGYPIVVGIVITEGHGGNVITKIRTVHPRGKVSNINDTSILYLSENKKETQKWFQARGIPVPLGGKTFGLIRSIAYTPKKVNSKALENSTAKSPGSQEGNNSAEKWSLRMGDAREKMAEAAPGREELGAELDAARELLQKAHKELDKAQFDAWLQGEKTEGRVKTRKGVLSVVRKYNDEKLTGISNEKLTDRIMEGFLHLKDYEFGADELVYTVLDAMAEKAAAQSEAVENENRAIIRGVTNGGKYSISDEEFDELAEMAGGRRHQNFFAEIRDRLTGLMLI